MNYDEVKNKLVEKGVKLSSAKVYVSKFKRIILGIGFNEHFTINEVMKHFISFQVNNSLIILDFVNKPETTINEKDNLLIGFWSTCLYGMPKGTRIAAGGYACAYKANAYTYVAGI